VINKELILVSNPGKQYTHQLLNALQNNNRSYKFITSFWYKPNHLFYNLLNIFPNRFKDILKQELLKRYDKNIYSDNVIQFPYFEFVREGSDKIFGQRFAERMQYWRDRFHDKYTSSRLKHLRPEIVIGYEESCLATFREAKKLGITTVLDLAQIHYREITNISNQYPAFKEIYKNILLREKINQIKEEELRLADHIICLSEWAKESLVKNNIPLHKIHVANLGFDPDKFKAKESYTIGEKLKILFVGTLTKRKGIDLLLKISDELSHMVELTLVGPLADAKELINAQKESFTIHRSVNHDQLSRLYRDSDLFVFPSYVDSWAMVVIEAMASGLPVIVSGNTGAKDAVKNNSGFVIPAGDFKSLKEKISFMYNNRNLLEEMGKNARKESLDYTWNSYHFKINKIIDDIRSNEIRR
jgi:glycosyltransferase involved in cell wall biosynthesis